MTGWGRPGSTLWLLRHELRLLGRQPGLLRRVGDKAGLVGLLLLAGAAQLGGIAAAASVQLLPPAALELLAAGVALFLFLMIMADVILSAVDALFVRRDLLWIAASPIPIGRVLMVRLLAVTVSSSLPFLMLGASPLIDGLALFRGAGMLLAYGAFAGMALLGGTLGCLLTLLLFRVAGPRRARTMATTLASLTTLAALFGAQGRTLLGAGPMGRVTGVLLAAQGKPEWWLAWVPARAALGEPGAVLALLGTALLVAPLAARLGGGWFLGAAMRGATDTGRARPRERPAGSRWAPVGQGTALRRTALRLLRRTPGLVGQVVLSFVYMIPGLLLAIRAGDRQAAAAIGAFPVIAAGIAAHLLASATALSEQCPDLVASAPVTRRLVMRAHATAAVQACVAVLVLPVAVVAVVAPEQAPIMLAGTIGAAGTAIRGGLRRPVPPRGSDLGGSRATSGRGSRGFGTMLWFAATLGALQLSRLLDR